MTQDELEAGGLPPGATTAPGWTWKPYEVPPQVYATLSAAVSDVGKREVGATNDGPDLAKFKTQGRAWCALAVSEWLREGLLDQGGCPWGVIASALGIKLWGEKQGRSVPVAQARPGDVFVILRGEPDPKTGWQPGHVGLIAHVDGSVVYSIEGNSGNKVAANRRALASFNAVVRPIL